MGTPDWNYYQKRGYRYRTLKTDNERMLHIYHKDTPGQMVAYFFIPLYPQPRHWPDIHVRCAAAVTSHIAKQEIDEDGGV